MPFQAISSLVIVEENKAKPVTMSLNSKLKIQNSKLHPVSVSRKLFALAARCLIIYLNLCHSDLATNKSYGVIR